MPPDTLANISTKVMVEALFGGFALTPGTDTAP
jgi:hypothetical protein